MLYLAKCSIDMERHALKPWTDGQLNRSHSYAKHKVVRLDNHITHERLCKQWFLEGLLNHKWYSSLLSWLDLWCMTSLWCLHNIAELRLLWHHYDVIVTVLSCYPDQAQIYEKDFHAERLDREHLASRIEQERVRYELEHQQLKEQLDRCTNY